MDISLILLGVVAVVLVWGVVMYNRFVALVNRDGVLDLVSGSHVCCVLKFPIVPAPMPNKFK